MARLAASVSKFGARLHLFQVYSFRPLHQTLEVRKRIEEGLPDKDSAGGDSE